METTFLGFPPAAPEQWIGRIHVWEHDPATTWTRGALRLPGGTAIHWIAYSDSVHRAAELFQPSTRVVVTGYGLAGDTYLTGIRPATDTEWQDAVDTLNRLPAAA